MTRLALACIAALWLFVLWVESLPMPVVGSGEDYPVNSRPFLARSSDQGLSGLREAPWKREDCPGRVAPKPGIVGLWEWATGTTARSGERVTQATPGADAGRGIQFEPYLLRPVAAGWGQEPGPLTFSSSLPDSLPSNETHQDGPSASDRSGRARTAMTVRLTWYTDRGTTRWGCVAGPGIVASDPSVISPMSIVLLDGDEYLVCDTGDFTGAWLDFWVPSVQAGRELVARFGKYVEIEILGGVK